MTSFLCCVKVERAAGEFRVQKLFSIVWLSVFLFIMAILIRILNVLIGWQFVLLNHMYSKSQVYGPAVQTPAVQ